MVLPGIAGLATPDLVGLPTPRDGEQPGVGIVRHAVSRPHSERRRECFAQGIFRPRHVAGTRREERDEATIALARNTLGSPGRLGRIAQFRFPCAATTGRISIEPYLLEGQRLAQAMAPSRSGASMKK